jgi:hypothetical protein
VALRDKTITITADNRDRGKTFFLLEMPAMQAEDWAIRVLGAAARAGIDVEGLMSQGLAGIAFLGISALLVGAHSETKPLLDELMTRVTIIRDPKHPEIRMALVDSDIEEVETLILLKREVLQLHVNFSLTGAPSTSTGTSGTPGPQTTSPISPDTPTSPRQSVRSSPRKRPRL